MNVTIPKPVLPKTAEALLLCLRDHPVGTLVTEDVVLAAGLYQPPPDGCGSPPTGVTERTRWSSDRRLHFHSAE